MAIIWNSINEKINASNDKGGKALKSIVHGNVNYYNYYARQIGDS